MDGRQEMDAGNQRIGADRQRLFFGHAKQRAIVANAEFDITAATRSAIEVACDEFKFTT
jgi:hypothetical protein